LQLQFYAKVHKNHDLYSGGMKKTVFFFGGSMAQTERNAKKVTMVKFHLSGRYENGLWNCPCFVVTTNALRKCPFCAAISAFLACESGGFVT